MGEQKKQQGQIALIALLVLTIATTVGLSLVARSTTDIALTRNVEESTRAFTAAEAGIEEALRSGMAASGSVSPDLSITYSVTVASIAAATNTAYVFPKKTAREDTETIWLVNHKADGTLDLAAPQYKSNKIDICWSSETIYPAIIVTVLYKESSDGSFRIIKGAFDPEPARKAARQFSAPTDTISGCGAGTNTVYRRRFIFTDYSASIDPDFDTLIAVRVRPLYSDTQLAVISPERALPFQMTRLESVGKTASGATRKIIVYQEYRSFGTIFDHAIYSEGTFVH